MQVFWPKVVLKKWLPTGARTPISMPMRKTATMGNKVRRKLRLLLLGCLIQISAARDCNLLPPLLNFLLVSISCIGEVRLRLCGGGAGGRRRVEIAGELFFISVLPHSYIYKDACVLPRVVHVVYKRGETNPYTCCGQLSSQASVNVYSCVEASRLSFHCYDRNSRVLVAWPHFCTEQTSHAWMLRLSMSQYTEPQFIKW